MKWSAEVTRKKFVKFALLRPGFMRESLIILAIMAVIIVVVLVDMGFFEHGVNSTGLAFISAIIVAFAIFMVVMESLAALIQYFMVAKMLKGGRIEYSLTASDITTKFDGVEQKSSLDLFTISRVLDDMIITKRLNMKLRSEGAIHFDNRKDRDKALRLIEDYKLKSKKGDD